MATVRKLETSEQKAIELKKVDARDAFILEHEASDVNPNLFILAFPAAQTGASNVDMYVVSMQDGKFTTLAKDTKVIPVDAEIIWRFK